MSTTTMRQKIKDKAKEIRDKIFGREVREAMASGVELAGETAADAMDLATEKADEVNAKVIEANTAISESKTATENAITATTNANTATGKANTAATKADTATTKANTAATKADTVRVDIETKLANGEFKGDPGSINNAYAKDIKTANGSNVETELSAVKDMTSIVNLTLNANYPLVSSGNLNRVTIPFNVIVYNKPYGVGVSKYSDGVIKVEKDGVLDINVTLTLNPSSTDSQMLAGYHIYKNGDAIASVYHDPTLGKYTPISFGCVIPVGAGDLISVRCSPDASSQFKTSIHKTSNFRCVHHQMNID